MAKQPKNQAAVDENALDDAFSTSKFEVAELSGGQIAKAMLHDIKPIVGWLIVCLFVALGAVVLITFTPAYVGKIVDVLNRFVETGVFDGAEFSRQIIILACSYIGYAILVMLKTFLLNNVMSRHFNNKLRIRMSEKIMNLPVSYVDKTSKGELIERMTDDVSVIGSTIHQLIDLLVTGLIQLVLIFLFAFFEDWHMALVLAGVVPLCILGGIGFAALASKHFHNYMEKTGKLYSLIEESYSGIKTVRSYGMEGFMKARHASINSQIAVSGFKGYFIGNALGPAMMFISSVAFALVCLIGGFMIEAGVGVTVGAVVAVVLYSQQISAPLESIANSMGMFQRARVAAKRIYGMLALPEIEVQAERRVFSCDSVEFRDVSFGYTPESTVINGLSLSVKRGQKIAIVGPTGGGKTTIVNLLMRFYDADSGEILIDGVDIKTINRDSVRDCFEMVLQDTWLFGGTIADNVAYGSDNVTREQIAAACKAAYCDTFINTLPDGYDTVITQGTANISQGQKQLLTIARAFIADRPMLILDEATSNVDTRTEILLQRAMDRLMTGRTCFVIAHRLSTIINADNIIVIDGGRIVEQGTHSELMSKGGFYAEMFNSQYSIM